MLYLKRRPKKQQKEKGKNMFRKIVSNLAFSPALVGQLSFYAKRLRKEETTRRIGLIFTALALVVQSFAVFSPPQSANASSPSDFVSGGVSSVSEYLRYYDQNSRNIKDIFTSIGITREEIAATKAATLNSRDAFSWGMTSHFSAAQGEGAYNYKKNNGATGVVYHRPLSLWDSTSYTIKNGSTYDVYVGNSKKFGWFAIMKACGNLATKKIPVPPTTPPKVVVPPQVTPVAECSFLNPPLISNNKIVQLSGGATTSGGATVSKYTFTIKDSAGRTISQKTIASNKLTASADAVSIANPGTYSASLSVTTSVGEKTNTTSCVKPFTITPPAACPYTPTLTATSPECQPCPGDSTLWIKDAKCTAQLLQTKTATNITQSGVDATTVIAKASDRISYTIKVKNIGLANTKLSMQEKLNDTLEYATVLDKGGATFDPAAKTLTWPDATLKPGEEQTRVFVVSLLDAIPSTPQGTSDKSSYDCVMTNTFGNSVAINVECPQVKQVEQIVAQLPHTGASENMMFAGIVLSVVTYFYARARQMKKEVKIIRYNLNAGSL